MNPLDPIILVIYLVCISYAIFKIIDSFNDEYTVTLDKDTLKEQLESQNLQDDLDISFGFDKRYEFGKSDKLKQFGINVNNKSKTHSIYVDWDYSVMTDLEGRSRRVTRLMPGTTLDLFQTQVFSTVAPETTLKETITAEDVLKRKEAKDEKIPVALAMEVDKPLLNFEALAKAKDATKNRKYARFVACRDPLDFSLELVIRLVGSARSGFGDRAHIRCKFILTKLPWTAGLPWNPK